MGISVEWYQNRKDVIRFIYDGLWTWDELWVAVEEGNKMMDTMNPKTVHIIIDMTKSSMMPQRPWDMGQKLNSMSRDNEGVRVVVGANTFVRMAQETMLKVYELGGQSTQTRKSRMVANLQEAEKVIAEYRPATDVKK